MGSFALVLVECPTRPLPSYARLAVLLRCFFFYTFRHYHFLSLMVCTTIDESCCYDLDFCVAHISGEVL